MSFRDVQILFANTLKKKQDQRLALPAVITDEAGNQEGSGSVWFSQAERMVWCMPLGGTQPSPKFCPSGLEPVIGLGVILGYRDGSSEQIILRADDEFFQKSSQAPQSFTALVADDLAPGGKQFLWLQSKALAPLAVWPGRGLKINVNPGDYSYQGTRKTFGGVTGYDLTSSKPSSGQHRLVGIYLDSSNILQLVNGTAVATSLIPPAPAWPSAAFRLATVKLAGSSTWIDFVNDVTDQRVLWSSSGAGVWPRPGAVNIGVTEYSSLTAALSAAVAGDVLILGTGTHSLAGQQTLAVELTLVGVNAADTIISGTAADFIKITAANVCLKNLTVQTTASGNPSTVRIEASCTLENVIIRTTSSGTDSYGVLVAGSGTFTTKLINCDSSATGGSGTKRALVVNNTNATVDVVGGEMGTTAPIFVVAGTCRLFLPRCPGGAPSATSGWYYNAGGGLVAVGSAEDIFPQASANGLNARFERLFGDDKPANSYKFTRRLFTVNDFVNNKAGFEDIQGPPYSFGGSPGGFSLSLPAGSLAQSNFDPHFLRMATSTASNMYLQWTSATAKNTWQSLLAVQALPVSSDYLMAELRGWAVQTPGAGDRYWAIRLKWLGISKPQHPLQISVYYGTGTTLSVTDGTQLGLDHPIVAGLLYMMVLNVFNSAGTPIGNGELHVADGFLAYQAVGAVAGWPTSLKTIRQYLNTNHCVLNLDEVIIT